MGQSLNAGCAGGCSCSQGSKATESPADQKRSKEIRTADELKGDWEVIPSIVDSGVVDTVGPKQAGSMFQIKPTEEYIAGIGIEEQMEATSITMVRGRLKEDWRRIRR